MDSNNKKRAKNISMKWLHVVANSDQVPPAFQVVVYILRTVRDACLDTDDEGNHIYGHSCPLHCTCFGTKHIDRRTCARYVSYICLEYNVGRRKYNIPKWEAGNK